jgi:hypothetical protein
VVLDLLEVNLARVKVELALNELNEDVIDSLEHYHEVVE